MKQGYVLLEDKLKGEYKQAFEQVELYSTTHLIGVDTDSELMMELLDSLLEAQENGVPVSTIVGNDVESFCDNFFSEYRGSSRFLDMLQTFYHMAWLVFAFGLLDFLCSLGETGTSGKGNTPIGGVLIGFSIGMILNSIVYFLLRPLVYKHKKLKQKTFQGILTALTAGALILSFVLSVKYMIEVPSFWALVITGTYIAVYKIVKMVQNHKKYGTIKEPRQENISFKNVIREDVRHGMPAEWLKQLRKKNERRKKRGREPLTEQEFLRKLDKQYDYKRMCAINIFIFGGCTVAAWIVTALVGGFESAADAVIFLLLLGGIEGLIYALFRKITKSSSEIYRVMRERMQAENLTLEQYAEISERENPAKGYFGEDTDITGGR